MKSECLICQLEEARILPIICCDEEVVLWQNMDVYLPGYFIIAPRQHVLDYAEISDEVAVRLFQVTKKVIRILQEKYDAKKIYQCCFSELTPHIHFHLFPRYGWMKDIKEVCVNGVIDGAKLFSFVREKYLVKDDQEKKGELLDFVKEFKKVNFNC